jgi:NAD(P)-dependent dehydrogenase (short-subunit alcohol dehydrogenase family)
LQTSKLPETFSVSTNKIDLLSPFLLTGKVALVTGGNSGIGKACVERLHDFGATVAFTFVAGLETESIALAGFAGFERVSAHAFDLREPDSIRACVERVINRYGAIDILVNNAAVGTATVARFSESVDAQDSAMLDINADGTLKMCQAYLAGCEKDLSRRRKLINISSVGGGITAFPGFRLSDGMSKAAVAFLTRQLAAEHVHSMVDIFAVCPGATNTPMFQASTLNTMTAEEREAFITRLPKQRLIEPEDIAAIVHFLATDLSTPMHGAVIDASMGLGVRPGLITESTGH